MLITNHVLSGALLGRAAANPGTALGAGLVSHFALDAIPHFGLGRDRLMRAAVPDGLVGLATIGVIAVSTPPEHRLRVLAGIVGACLPDLDKPGEQFFDRSPYPGWFDRFHSGIQSESPRRLPLELAVAAVLGFSLRSRLRR